MAGSTRPNARSLAWVDELRRAPERFDLFQALRRIECAYRDHARLGQGAHAADEPVRLSQEPTLAFSPRALVEVQQDPAGRPRIVTSVLGLLGPNGPLPLHLTDYVRDRMRNASDPTFARFLDLFHHRILSLYYRAWANTQPAVSFDRPESDRFAVYTGALMGMGLPSMGGREAIPLRARLYFAGLYASQVRNAEGLQAIVSDYFGIPARIEQFVAEWVDIPPPARWRLGAAHGFALGRRTALGKRARLCQSKFRIVLGPVDSEQFTRLLPGGESLERLASLVRGYAGDRLSWDVRLVLAEGAKTSWRLGGSARLGSTTWLGARPSTIVVQPPARSKSATAGGNRPQSSTM